MIPRVAFGVVDLHHAHALFDEARGGEAAAGGAALAIHLEDGFALLADVEDIGSFGLHAVGGLHGADGGFELRVVGAPGAVFMLSCVELLDEVELLALLLDVEAVVVDVGDELLGIEVGLLDLVGDIGSLVARRRESRAPERRANGGGNLRAEDDEAGEILVVVPRP
jgi:hypothetical protein